MRTLVIGMGISGLECARFLHGRGQAFDTFDDRKTREALADVVGAMDWRHFRDIAEVEINRYHEIVVSPGVPMSHPLLVCATEAGVPVVAEVELAWRHARGTIVAVTGSNGKSTTVSLIHHILAANGKNAVLTGNIGTPFIACVNDDPSRIYVLEISSFQMEHVDGFCPDIGLLLNISPDHLDRHGSMEAYEQAKFRMFARQTADHLAVADHSLVDRLPGKASRIAVPGPGAQITATELAVGDHFLLSQSAVPLPGIHNLTNTLFACIVADRLGLSADQVAASLPSFRGLEHRMEAVGEFEGRRWINDTKATNVHACQAAIDAMDEPYVLILGGCDKGDRFHELDFSRHRPRALITYGDTAPKIQEDLQYLDPIHIHAFKDACLEAHRRAEPGDVVLLAPACASFDQFDNFAARGTYFKQLFRELTS